MMSCSVKFDWKSLNIISKYRKTLDVSLCQSLFIHKWTCVKGQSHGVSLTTLWSAPHNHRPIRDLVDIHRTRVTSSNNFLAELFLQWFLQHA